jgi:hypothetical protein
MKEPELRNIYYAPQRINYRKMCINDHILHLNGPQIAMLLFSILAQRSYHSTQYPICCYVNRYGTKHTTYYTQVRMTKSISLPI